MNRAAKNGAKKQAFEQDLILDHLDALIYVVDMNSYRILYMNKHAKELYGDVAGQICWEKFQEGQTGPCKFCDKENLLKNAGNKLPSRDEQNPINNKWYETYDNIIHWSNNEKARLHVAYDITNRKTDEINLKIHLKQQELFSNIALTFNQQKPFANKVNEVLHVVGKFVNADRVSLYENFAKNTKTQLTYEWCNKNVSAKLNKLPSISFDKHHPLYKRILKDKILNLKNITESEYFESLKVFVDFKVKSMLLIPIFLHKNHMGFISFEKCNKTRNWNENETNLLSTFGNIISTAFERKTIEEKRLRSEQKLKIANATKNRFLSIITRDLQTPFSDLKSLSSLLADSYDKWDNQKRKIFIDSILNSSSQGYNLLNNLIVWSKIQSKQISFNPESIDIKSVIGQTIEKLQSRADRKEIKISGIPENQIFVCADYYMLNTVFHNLVNNAIKFTKFKGSITIILKTLKKNLEVSICDTGVGIKKEDLNKLFRIDIDQTTFGPPEEKGTGLGLIICKEYVKKNGGKIWLESEFKKGSEFKFTVPLSKWYRYFSK
ncbi:MAG: ATP-binding protein [Bacteroidota bacterium]